GLQRASHVLPRGLPQQNRSVGDRERGERQLGRPLPGCGSEAHRGMPGCHGRGKAHGAHPLLQRRLRRRPGELSPLAFSRTYVSPAVRAGLDYVLLSYYEGDCRGVRPSAATWTAYFQQLHALYPNALLGFGEIEIG